MDSTAALWIDVDEPTEAILPPVDTRVQVLPLEKLSWDSFERLCYRMTARLADVADCRRYGIQGQDQQGIDIYARQASDGKYSTWQCKRYSKFDAAAIEKAVSKFLENEWAKTSAVFYLAVTVNLSLKSLVQAIEKQAKRCRKAGVEFVPLDLDRLSDLLKRHPDLVDDFFGRAWVEAFCGSEAAQGLSGRRLTKQERIRARQKLRELYATHFASVDIGLPAASGALRHAAPYFSLHKRYVIPSAESLDTIIEPCMPLTESGASHVDTPRSHYSSTGHDKSGQPSGFRVKEQRTKIDLLEWLTKVQQAVIMGGPGLGKSAALRFLALDLLSDDPRSELLARRWGSYLPLFVPFAMLVRLVGSEEVVSIEDVLRGWLQKLTAPEETIILIEKALDDERLLLLIDGLDEWTDSTAAGTALVKLLDFVIPRRIPVIASARPLGYERLGGLGVDWKKCELLSFEAKQQKEFTEAWFGHFYEATLPKGSTPESITSAARRDTEAFISEVQTDDALSELAGTPLLLSALIYLRLQGRLLPRSRFDALEAITKTLIDEQPQRRAQASLQGTGTRINPRLAERGMQFLALYIFQSPGSESITEDKAREALATFYQEVEFRKSAAEAIELADAQVERATHEVGIVVQRQPGQIGFLHRSLQEFLAAKDLSRQPFEQIRACIVEKSAEPGWQEILLAVLYLLTRQDEVDSILKAVLASPSEPLERPLRQIFLARAVFSDLNCSATVAEEIAEEILATVETAVWMPLRRRLLTEAVRGIDSEVLGARIRNRLKQWFPSRQRWKSSLYSRLASMPDDSTHQKLYVALINANGASEQKAIAEAIAHGAALWSNISDRLSNLLIQAADGDLLAAALHALATGWPEHADLPVILSGASDSTFDEFRCVALVHRAKRGERTEEIKSRLGQFCRRFSNIYPWEEELLNVLTDCWPRNAELREVALTAVRKKMMPTEWGDRIAFAYLIRAFPHDDEVAEIIANTIREEEHLSTKFDHGDGWNWILAGFKAHPLVVPAAEEWLEKHAITTYDGLAVKQLTGLAATEKCKQFLIALLKDGKSHPLWIVNSLVDFGASDLEIRKALLSFIADEKRVGTIASYLPDFLDKDDCCKRLLSLLESVQGFEVGHVLSGLDRIGLLDTPQVISIIERRLRDDEEGHFWWGANTQLLRSCPHNHLVREHALKDLDGPDPSLSLIADAYAGDALFRPLLDRLIQPLHDDLRLTLVQTLRSFVLREDPFARDLLSSYRLEWNAEVRTAAAIGYYTAVKKRPKRHESEVAELLDDLNARGPGYDERRQSAVAGLLVLGQEQKLMDALAREGSSGLGVSMHVDGDRNWELIHIIVDAWDTLTKFSGEEVWNAFHEWDVFIWLLSQAGKRHFSLTLPANLIAEAERQAYLDVDVFRALSILREGQESFRDLCVGWFSKFRNDQGYNQIGWGYNEVGVWFEAARYLAEHHAGEVGLGAQLEDIAQHSHDPSGPIVALCRGWPSSPMIQNIWNSCRNKELNAMPDTAWIVAVKATPAQFANYVLSLPENLHRDTWWRFPRESMQPVRRRLASDLEAQRIILSSANTPGNHDVIASLSRLLGTVASDRLALRDWVRDQLELVRKPGMVQPLGYDMLEGAVRPVEFCLLEACLTSY